jgi:Flp pilus assembly protein TadD
LNLAEVYSVQGRFEEARTVLLEAIRKQPSAGDAYYALALVYFQEGRLMEAESAAVQAHARPHQIADVHLILAEIYRTQQQAVAAAEELQIYLKEAPSGPNSERVRAVLKSLPK